MAKLPTIADLGEMPSAKVNAPIYHYDVSAAGRGQEALGHALLGLGEKLDKGAEEQDRLNAQREVLSFSRDQEKQLEDSISQMQPGGAGFSEAFRSNYDQGANQLMDRMRASGMSERALAHLDIGLLQHGGALGNRAHEIARREQGNYQRDLVQGKLEDYVTDMQRDPYAVQERKQLGLLDIQTSPMSPADQRRVRDWFTRRIDTQALAYATAQAMADPAQRQRFMETFGLTIPGRTIQRQRPTGAGFLEEGNVDLSAIDQAPRPSTERNAAGFASRLPTYTVEANNRFYVVPEFDAQGRRLGRAEAQVQYEESGRHLGSFATRDAAEGYSRTLWEGPPAPPATPASTGPAGAPPAGGPASSASPTFGPPAAAPAAPGEPLQFQTVPAERQRVGARARPEGTDIQGVVIHHTSGSTLDSALNTNRERGTGANFYLDRDGTWHSFIPVGEYAPNIRDPGARERRTGAWDNLTNANTLSIEVVARNDADVTPAQRQALRDGLPRLQAQYGFDRNSVVGHGEIQGGHPFGNKEDNEGRASAQEFRGLTQQPAVAAGPGAQPALAEPAAPATPGRPRLAQAPGGPQTDATPGLPAPGAPANPADDGGLRYTHPLGTSIGGGALRSAVQRVLGAEHQEDTALIQSIDSFEKGAAQGFLPMAEAAAIERQVRERGSAQARALWASTQEYAAQTRQFMRMHPAAMDDVVAERRANMLAAGRGDRRDIERLQHWEALAKKAKEQSNTDPVGWAVWAGYETRRASFDPSNDGAMAAYAAQANRVAQMLDRPVRFMSPVDLQAAQGILRQGPDRALPLLGSMLRNWGPGSINELSEKGPDGTPKHPELTALAGMYVNSERNGGVNRDMVTQLATAVHMRDNPEYRALMDKHKVDKTDQEGAEAIIGTAFRETGATRAAVTHAATLLYEQWATTNNITTFNKAKYQEFLLGVIGQAPDSNPANRNRTYGGLYTQGGDGLFGSGLFVGRNGGNPVPVPSNIRTDALPTVMQALTADDLRRFGASERSPAAAGTDYEGYGGVGPVDKNGREIDIADLRRKGYLVYAGGHGRYFIAQNDPDAAAAGGTAIDYARAADGTRFVLDLDRLDGPLKERVPEIYRGYVPGPSVAPRSLITQGEMAARFGMMGARGDEVIMQPGDPRYPSGEFAPRTNQDRALTLNDALEFQRRLRERYPTRVQRNAVESNPDRYQTELRDFIESLPAPRNERSRSRVRPPPVLEPAPLTPYPPPEGQQESGTLLPGGQQERTRRRTKYDLEPR